MESNFTGPRWAARLDAQIESGDYHDLLKVVACYYEMYERGYNLIGPWISRSRNSTGISIPPDKSVIAHATRPRSAVSASAHNAFVDALYKFAVESKGKRQLINPDPTTHHSAQFTRGSFSITTRKSDVLINLYGCSEPLIVEGLKFNPESVEFIIVRPKLGKLGTSSTKKWEVLFFKSSYSFLIDHVDSNLNPRWSGII